jgi:putative spermidine/putrescine transport system permease protein
VRLSERARVWAMLAPALAVIVALFLGGILLGLAQSLNYMPVLGKTDVNFDAYAKLFGDVAFHRSLLLTFHIAFTATIVSTILAVGCALVLRQTFAGKRLATFLFQLNLPIPHVVGGVALIMLASQSGLLSRLAYQTGWITRQSDFPALVFDPWGIGVILEYVWKEVPFTGVIVLGVLQSLGTDYEELAASLGANRWQRFRHVMLPLMMPGVLSASIIVFAFSFGAFEIPYLLGASFPVPLSVVAYKAYSDADLNAQPEAMAMSVIIAALITLLTLAYMKLSRAYLRSD